MRLYKTLFEQSLENLDMGQLLERLARIERLLQLAQDEGQKRRLLMMKSRLQQLIENYVPYVSPSWGNAPQTIDNLIELLENVDPNDSKATRLARQIKLFVEEYGESEVATQLLELVQDLDTNEEFANYNNYDYSEITKYLTALMENEDILEENPWVAQAANDFHKGFGATTMFGMLSSTDWPLVESGFKQIRTADEFKLVNDFYSGELQEDGGEITEAAARASHRRPANGFNYFYKYIVGLGISHTLPSYWYYDARFGGDPNDDTPNYLPAYGGLPDFADLEELGYEYVPREGITFNGSSGMSIDREGKISYGGSALRAESIQESEEVVSELTYHGDEFFEDYGVMWFNEDEDLDEAEYRGRKVKLGKPMRGDVKKFKVYVKNPKGNVVKVNFGDPDMKIKKSNPARRRSFRARHNCDNPGPRHKARYWSCRKW